MLYLNANFIKGSKVKSSTSGEDTEWKSLEPFLIHNWIPCNNTYHCQYKRVGGVVYLRGLVKGGDDKYVIKNLPEDIRPKQNVYISVAGLSNLNVKGQIKGGSVCVHTNGTVEFRKYSKDWTSLECSYRID